jgi:plastocyanin
MRFSLAVAAFAPALSAYAANILVQVGAGGELAFSPTNITAQVGDVVAFQFQGKNHSVTQSTFADPCSIQTTPAQGISSGFQPVAANATELPEWSFTVNNASAPLWFFCAQTNPKSHCEAGMVFSVNANPNSAKSFAVYQAAAMAGNAAAAAVSGVASAAGAAATDATSLFGDATSAVASAAGSAETDAANALSAGGAALTGLAGAITGTGSSSAASPTGSSPSAGSHVTSSAVSLLAVVGLAAGMLL